MGSNPIGTAIPHLNYKFIMKNVFYFITALILIAGCANIEEEHDVDSTSTSTNSVVATSGTKFSSPRTASIDTKEIWRTGCYSNQNAEELEGNEIRDNSTNYFSFSFEDNTISAKVEKYSDDNCSVKYYSHNEFFTYSMIDSSRFTATSGSFVELTPQSNEAVDFFNKNTTCKYDEWELNVTKKCDNEILGLESQTVYCSYYYEENALYSTCDPDDYPTEDYTEFTRIY